MPNKRKQRDPFVIISFIICVAAIVITAASMTVKALSSGVPEITGPAEAVGADATGTIIEEDFWGDGQRHVRVNNVGSTPVYVKITPSFVARNGSGEICDTVIRDDEIMMIDHDNWIPIGSSYYYVNALGPGKYTPFFISSCKSADAEGNALEIRFMLETVPEDEFKALTENK